MHITIESNFQKRVMVHRLEVGPEESQTFSRNTIEAWKKLWTAELGKWHSPYKSLIDLSLLTSESFQDQDFVSREFAGLLRFFFGFFMQRAAIVGSPSIANVFSKQDKVEFFQSLDDALVDIGLDKQVGMRKSEDFRSLITLQNHFAQRTMELSFAEPTKIDTIEKIKVVQSKITNNLMQWHSKWNLLIDVQNLEEMQDPAIFESWANLFSYLKKLFMLQVVGYGGKGFDATLPCQVFRARHKAVAMLDSATQLSSDEAHCRSGKKS